MSKQLYSALMNSQVVDDTMSPDLVFKAAEHQWNSDRCLFLMRDQVSPIIIASVTYSSSWLRNRLLSELQRVQYIDLVATARHKFIGLANEQNQSNQKLLSHLCDAEGRIF